MSISITVIAANELMENRWAKELGNTLSALLDVRVQPKSAGMELGQVVFIDGGMPGLDGVLESVDRRGRALFLLVEDPSGIPPALSDGRVDDVLVHPFRPLEALSKIQRFQQIMMWDEVSKLNESFHDLLGRLQEDLRLAERLQKAKSPVRFPELKGFRTSTRYMVGMKSGGDHFDLAESKDSSQLAMILSDSSSYGLSSSVLSVLMRVAVKLSTEESRSSHETVRRIHEELLLTLGEKDQLSLFYGVLSRKDYRLRYLNLGSSRAFYAPPGADFQDLPSHGGSISRSSGAIPQGEGVIALEPEGRLILLSDGFLNAIGDAEAVRKLLNSTRRAESADLVNELVFRVKSRFAEPDDLPEQDCTVAVLDVDSRVIRLA